ncbi:DNA ligase IV [Pholiota molesta]|nr:DNA ligase IV [Pholiota molesta]
MQRTPAPTSPPNPASQSYPAPPQNVSSAPFGILVRLFEKLQVERKQDRRRKLIDAWFTHWRKEKGYDLYPVLRLLLPQKDRERAVYGLKEKNLAKTYIKLIPLGMRDPDAIRLLNWKKPTERGATSGDFPTVLYEVVSKRSSVIEGSLSIDDLNDILDELAKNMGKQYSIQDLQRVYNRATPEEQRWITTIFSVFHPDAQDLYNTCSDLKKVAWELWDPHFRLNSAQSNCSAFAPMLCKRPTRKIEERKLDGERMQLHKRGNEYFYCSRKGKDYTYLYGKHVGSGSLTPYIDKPSILEIILDGEMLVWDPVSERNLPFGTLKTAALDKTKTELNPRPCFKVFDLLYLNGQALLHRSTNFRKKNMRSCLKEIPGRVEFAIDFKGKTAKDIREKMDEIMATRGEGLVIKHPLSEYVLNGRNKDWIKVKPEYMDNMGETVDVLVVAGNYGSGKRSGGVSTLICAVFDDQRSYEDDDEEPKYRSFVRIGTGLSFADYVWIRSKPWKTWDPKNPPAFLETAKRGQEDKGDLYLNPEDSFIIKVKAAEITPSDQYHMGFTMRFPRALSIRDDLSVGDCMSASAVLETLRSERKRKMQGDAGVTKKKRKTTVKKVAVLPQYQGPKMNGVTVETDIFEGMKFGSYSVSYLESRETVLMYKWVIAVVMSDPKSRTGEEDRKTLSKLIYANGGACAQIATSQPDCFVVYGGTVTPYDLKLIMNKGPYFFHATEERMATKNTMKTWRWPRLKGGRGDRPEVKEEEMNPELAEWFKVDDKGTAEEPPSSAGRYDEDSVTEEEPDSENEDVKEEPDDWVEAEVISKSAGKQPEKDVDVKMGETEEAMEYDQGIFSDTYALLDTAENAEKNGMTIKPSKYRKDIDKNFEELAKLITENGGKIVNLDEPKLTHVVVDKRDESRRLELIRRTAKPKRRHLVISEYIRACLDEGTLLDEDGKPCC